MGRAATLRAVSRARLHLDSDFSAAACTRDCLCLSSAVALASCTACLFPTTRVLDSINVVAMIQLPLRDTQPTS